MKRAAIKIHDLVHSVGIGQARIVGHDIGLMVAYAYAAQFPSETEKLVVMDAFLPGVQGWEPIYNSPNYWHFRFNGRTAEAIEAYQKFLNLDGGQHDTQDFQARNRIPVLQKELEGLKNTQNRAAVQTSR